METAIKAYFFCLCLASYISHCTGCANGTVRLSGSNNSSQGRVEICYLEKWGTVCADSFWGVLDANVVCRELNLSSNGARISTFDEGSGPVWLDEVYCEGDENRLVDCPASLGGSDCQQHAGVICSTDPVSPCNHSDVRLVGGCHSLEGRVEVCIHGEWGTVCDDFWDDVDAQVVCNQLGYNGTSALAFSKALYGIGSTEAIFLDTVECEGDEDLLLNCSSDPIEVHDCFHFEDASVSCFQPGCTEGDIRLAEGSFYEGRVEVCQDGLWGTVCDDLWEAEDASVVCGQLGLDEKDAVTDNFGSGCGAIFFDNVECEDMEERLEMCSKAVFGNCDHTQDAGVKCALSSIDFIPFGIEEGDDIATNEGVSSSLGPLDLPTPVVYYLQEEYQVYVSTMGEIAFQEEFSMNSTAPMIAPEWFVNHTLYARVAEDELTLNLVRGTLQEENQQMADFMPSLAVIITWHNDNSTEDTLQAILSTNGLASFATYLFSDGHGLGILEHQNLLVFRAGDGRRRAVPENLGLDLERLRKLMNSFRIDGHCITLDSPDQACSLGSYSVNCEQPLSASSCRCYYARSNSSVDTELSGSGAAPENSIMNDTGGTDHNSTTPTARSSTVESTAAPIEDGEVNENITQLGNTNNSLADTETCDATSISCIPGSVASPCIPPGALDTGYSGCYPTLLPCYFEENCFNETELSDCQNSGLTVFGEGAGDLRGAPEDEGAFGPVSFSVPVIYLEAQQYRAYMSTNGILSFENPYFTYMICGSLPCAPQAIIAPAWTDLDFRGSGVTFYRSSQDPATLSQIAGAIATLNPVLSDYRPVQFLVFTWFEARSFFDDELTMLGDQQGDLQLVVSTDGEHSFATFVYSEPETIFHNVLEPEVESEDDLEAVIGFDNGMRTGGDFGLFLMTNNRSLPAVTTFRIDGRCVTTILPGDACSLEATTTKCADFKATTCQCQIGYEYIGVHCVDINECERVNRCHQESTCSNTLGSFECVCNPGYTGDGFTCENINECSLDICGDFSECIDTPGNFTCVCDSGYELMGRTQCIEIILPTGAISVTAPAVASVVVAVVLLGVAIVVSLLVIQERRRRKKLRDSEKAFDRRRMTVQSSFKLEVKESLMVRATNIGLGKTLGQGEFGIVYKAVLESETGKEPETVAVKTLKGFMQKELVTEMLKECDMMKDFDHPNVLGLKGVCLDGGPAPFIILSFMSKGSLLGYLKDNRKSLVLDSSAELDVIEDVQKKLLDMCLQVGRGMQYLAEKRLVHRDLAARNLMVDSNFIIKVADFGLSVILDPEEEFFQQEDEESVKLPMKWLAIESINERMFSEKTDVWAFGVTCWEIYTGGKTPYPDIHPMDLPCQLEEGYRMPKPSNAACSEDLYNIVMNCWDEDSEIRPTFAMCVDDLNDYMVSMNQPSEVGLSMNESSEVGLKNPIFSSDDEEEQTTSF